MTPTLPMHLDSLVKQAVAGDRKALDAVVRAIQDDIYGLSLRMLWRPADAADATQEILVQIITHLSTFRGESSFRTWCFRIASNALVRAKKQQLPVLEPIDERMPEHPVVTPEERLLEKEVRLHCSIGLLQVLDAEHRLAYVVGEILGLSSDDAAEVTQVESATFRKRLSRSRARMRTFLNTHCGIVNPDAACRCSKRFDIVDADQRPFTSQRERISASVLEKAAALAATDVSTTLYRAAPSFAAPEALGAALRTLLAVP